MKILVAPDKFKGTLTAREVCRAVEEGLCMSKGALEINKTPLADGGEGTVEILTEARGGRSKMVRVLDPLFRPIDAAYGIASDGKTAFIEMAAASGLQLLKPAERNPLYTSSIGTGQLIADALEEGVSHLVLGIGGSATNDAGIGLASALGFHFISHQNETLAPIGNWLAEIAHIDNTHPHPRLKEVSFTILCDVDNPLYGPTGAACVYGPQKGASPQSVIHLDKGLEHFAQLVKTNYHININFPGAGAAGGLGAACKLFLNASFQKGIEYVSREVDLEEKIKWCDEVITGEGKVDEQTFSGKVVAHVVELAKKHSKPVTLICGQSTFSKEELNAKGIDHLIALARTPDEVEMALKNTYTLLVDKMKSR